MSASGSASSSGSSESVDQKELQQDLLAAIELLRKKDGGACQNHPNSVIDFNKLVETVEKGSYETVDQFKVDFRLKCLATMKANPCYTIVHKRATKLLFDGLTIILKHLGHLYEQDARPCSACRKTNHPTKTLLCDLCNDPYHMFCLPQPLDAIPSGAWYCTECSLLEQNQLMRSYLKKAQRKREKIQEAKILKKQRKLNGEFDEDLESGEGNFDIAGSALESRRRILESLPSSPLFPSHVLVWLKTEFVSPIENGVLEAPVSSQKGKKRKREFLDESLGSSKEDKKERKDSKRESLKESRSGLKRSKSKDKKESKKEAKKDKANKKEARREKDKESKSRKKDLRESSRSKKNKETEKTKSEETLQSTEVSAETKGSESENSGATKDKSGKDSRAGVMTRRSTKKIWGDAAELKVLVQKKRKRRSKQEIEADKVGSDRLDSTEEKPMSTEEQYLSTEEQGISGGSQPVSIEDKQMPIEVEDKTHLVAAEEAILRLRQSPEPPTSLNLDDIRGPDSDEQSTESEDHVVKSTEEDVAGSAEAEAEAEVEEAETPEDENDESFSEEAATPEKQKPKRKYQKKKKRHMNANLLKWTEERRAAKKEREERLRQEQERDTPIIAPSPNGRFITTSTGDIPIAMAIPLTSQESESISQESQAPPKKKRKKRQATSDLDEVSRYRTRMQTGKITSSYVDILKNSSLRTRYDRVDDFIDQDSEMPDNNVYEERPTSRKKRKQNKVPQPAFGSGLTASLQKNFHDPVQEILKLRQETETIEKQILDLDQAEMVSHLPNLPPPRPSTPPASPVPMSMAPGALMSTIPPPVYNPLSRNTAMMHPRYARMPHLAMGPHMMAQISAHQMAAAEHLLRQKKFPVAMLTSLPGPLVPPLRREQPSSVPPPTILLPTSSNIPPISPRLKDPIQTPPPTQEQDQAAALQKATN